MNDLVAQRSSNLRQLLARSSRRVNEQIVSALRTRGYPDVRIAHSTVLANLDLGGSSVSAIAARALVPKQAVSKLVLELDEMGYLSREVHDLDRRWVIVRLTRKGTKLMHVTLEVIAEFEGEIAAHLGPRRYRALCDTLAQIADGLPAEN